MEITPQEAAALVDSGNAQLVDVREPYEHEVGHITGANHVPMAELAQTAESMDRDRPIVFYCRLGGRSLMAAQAFAGAGYDARSIAGGILAWQREGLPMQGEVADH